LAVKSGHKWVASLSQLNQVMMALCKDSELATPRRQTRTVPQFKAVFDGHVMRKIDNSTYHCKDGFLGNGKIDAVLLSIGGNDVGFFSAVMHALLPPLARGISLWEELRRHKQKDNLSWTQVLFSHRVRELDSVLTAKQASARARERLPELYSKLDAALERHLGLTDARRVIVALYPSPNTDERGNLCHTGKGLERFDIPGEMSLRDYLLPFVTRDESRDLERFVEAINTVISKAPYRENRRWTLANSHLEKFRKRGWCASGGANELTRTFNAFEETARLFRTPNDGYRTQNQLVADAEVDALQEAAGPIDARFRRLVATYGLFHPTNFGYAMIGDAYLKSMKCVLDGKCGE
jgi:hypothetical protein